MQLCGNCGPLDIWLYILSDPRCDGLLRRRLLKKLLRREFLDDPPDILFGSDRRASAGGDMSLRNCRSASVAHESGRASLGIFLEGCESRPSSFASEFVNDILHQCLRIKKEVGGRNCGR